MLVQLIDPYDGPICLITVKHPFHDDFKEELRNYNHSISSDPDEFIEYLNQRGIIAERTYIDEIIEVI